MIFLFTPYLFIIQPLPIPCKVHLIHCKTKYKKYTMREQIIFVVCITRRNDSHVDSMTNGLLLLKLMPGYCFPDTKEWKYRFYFCWLTLLLSGNGRPMAIERTKKKKHTHTNGLFAHSQQSHVIPFTKPMQTMMCPLYCCIKCIHAYTVANSQRRSDEPFSNSIIEESRDPKRGSIVSKINFYMK